MPELLRTTKTNEHTHIAYLKDDGSGVTSIDHKHSHTIMDQPPQSSVMDMQIGMVKEEDKDTILKDFLIFWDECKKLEEKSREGAIESGNMYAHKHWDAKKKTE